MNDSRKVEVDVLSLYESVAQASEQMVAAARASDWEALVAAESDCATRIEHLKSIGANRSLGAAGDKRRFDILRNVLAHDAEIRRLTQPWVEQLERMLGSAAAGRRVGEAYR